MVGKMNNRQLDTYLEELATSGLLETDSTCYLYLRSLAHHLSVDSSLRGYVRFKKNHNKEICKQSKYKLSHSSTLRQSIDALDLTLYFIGVKGRAWYLEQCALTDDAAVDSQKR